MKIINLATIVALSCIGATTVFYSCKKKDSDPAPGNLLCDGNGSNTYYPVATKNTWIYFDEEDGVRKPDRAIITQFKDSFINGKQYKAYTDSLQSYTLFIREDAATKDIYTYNPYFADEHLEVPANPSIGQEWNSIFYVRKVTSLSATLKTPACNYSGLLEITEYDKQTPRQKLYYKKGLGNIGTIIPPSGALPEKKRLLVTASLN